MGKLPSQAQSAVSVLQCTHKQERTYRRGVTQHTSTTFTTIFKYIPGIFAVAEVYTSGEFPASPRAVILLRLGIKT